MEDSVKELSKYRYENSLENIVDAKLMLDNGRYSIVEIAKNTGTTESEIAKIAKENGIK